MTSVNYEVFLHSCSGCESCYTMRINFQDAIKETSEQIKIRLKDKQISSFTDVMAPPL